MVPTAYPPRLNGLVDLLVESLLEDAREILDENGDVPPEYNAEDPPPSEDDPEKA